MNEQEHLADMFQFAEQGPRLQEGNKRIGIVHGVQAYRVRGSLHLRTKWHSFHGWQCSSESAMLISRLSQWHTITVQGQDW